MKKTRQNIIVGITVVIGILFTITFVNNLQSSSDKAFNQEEQMAPHYVGYSEASLVKAKENGRAVLFFWAPWCSTCSVLDDELLVRSNELPDDVTILKVNFDTQKDVNQKYFVTQQHTLVQIDKNGNEVNKWVGGGVDLLKLQLKEV